MNNITFKILGTVLFICSVFITMDVFFPKYEYYAEKLNSSVIKSNAQSTDDYYHHFDTFVYQGKLNANPGERVLVVYKKSRIFNNHVYSKEIHDNFKCK